MFSPSKEAPSSSQQPQKRKYVEYRDPDYDNGGSTSSKRACGDSHTESPSAASNSKQTFDPSSENSAKYKKICEIISKEFQHEIELKHQQLELIEERLSKAFHMLDRLRYAVVADYYRKQTVPLNPADAATIRGPQTLFDDESHGPQMALHPSLKKIIGKKPKTYEEILRACPTRAAAQNAKQTILVKSKSYKKRDARLKKLIKEEGIVIDHSKPITDPEINALKVFNASEQVLNIPTRVENNEKTSTETKKTTSTQPSTSGKSLNATRLNNKKKHLIVVGNTSKYIECEREDNDQKLTNKTLSYKWLVYVQSKDPSEPLESYIKKIRFFLHSSYRPNDVVDICHPPFQISRRGWGEFPLRIQVFFHDSLQQKPVQLVHNLVLDKSLSGLETLGSETLVEIWLRSIYNNIKSTQENESKSVPIKEKTINNCPPSSCGGKNASLGQKIIDDNLFEFLNKIEESPASVFADIEKIQPTVMVTEPITNIVHSNNKMIAKKDITGDIVPEESTNSLGDSSSIVKNSTCEKVSLNQAVNNNVSSKPPSIPTVENSTNMQKSIVLPPANVINTPNKPTNLMQIGKPKGSSVNVLKLLPKGTGQIVNIGKPTISNSVNNSNGLKVVNSHNPISNQPQSHGTTPIAPKKILQKKLVQLVDVHGNVKYVQMLVATSAVRNVTTSSTPIQTVAQTTRPTNDLGIIAKNNSSISSPSRDTNVMKIATINKTTADISEREGTREQPQTPTSINKQANALPNNINQKPHNNNHSKNVVFEKEGKVYIIDPMQVKLKQEQKKQVSLLKPQVSLLKQNQPKVKDATTPTVCDHDYVPVVSKPSLKPEVKLKEVKYSQVMKSTPFQSRTTAPQVHHGIKQARVNAGNALEIQQKERLAFDQQFMKASFISVREAVEYLLRQLPLVATPNHKVSPAVFPFISNSLSQFNALPAFKQRACEWLRAKYIARKLKAHKDLRKFNESNDPTINTLWTTREIAVFARHHAYTPIIKSLKPQSNEDIHQFTDLVKKELKNEQQIHYETITTNTCVLKWANDILENLNNQQADLTENQFVDIVNLESKDDCPGIKSENSLSPSKLSNGGQMLYLSTPENLDNESQLVRDICKDIGVALQPEEIIKGVVHPMAQTLMARCLRLFIEKLVRQSLGFKVSQQIIQGNSANDFPAFVEPQDIAKVINMFPELDYLSNRHSGTTKIDEFTEI